MTPPSTTSSATAPTEAPGNTSNEIVSVEKQDSQSRTLSLPRATEALRTFETSIGGREKLVDRLILADLDQKAQYLLRLMMNPKRNTDSLAILCREAGLKPADLLDLYRKSSFAVAQAQAIGIAADAMPAVTRDIAEKSVDRYVTCPKCDGNKTVQQLVKDEIKDVRCPNCGGRGAVLKESDLDRQRTLIDMLGLSPKAAPSIAITNNNANVGGGQVGALFSTFVKATDKAAYDIDPGEITEGRVIAPAEPSEAGS